MKNIKQAKLIEKKPIAELRYIIILNCILFAVFVASCVLVPAIINLLKTKQIDLNVPPDTTGIIITLATISISMFQIIIGGVNNRISMISYKGIFFKTTLWKWHNAINLMIILMEMIIISVFAHAFENSVHANIIQFIALLITIYSSYWIFYLSVVAVVKKSRIYYLLERRISKNLQNRNYKVIKDIIDKLIILDSKHEETIKRKHNSYLYEEIGILVHLYIAINGHEIYKDDTEYIQRKIISLIKEKIISDNRSLIKLKLNIIEKGNVEFEKNKSIWIEVSKKIMEI